MYKVAYYAIFFLAFLLIIAYFTFRLIKSRKAPTFVLLTDFGYDFAVGSMKGILAAHFPSAQIIDLDHTIAKFNIVSGGFVLAKSYHYFPQDTIFICIIDPGVGTSREPICIKTPSYTFIGPNNGIFDALLNQEPARTIYEIDNRYLKEKATTFHGRDLFVPAAIDIIQEKMDHFKPFNEKNLVHLPQSSSSVIVTYIDSFGNVKTNAPCNALAINSSIKITLHGKTYSVPFVRTFKEVPHDNLLCYKGSNGTLELAINEGSAANQFHIQVGNTLIIEQE